MSLLAKVLEPPTYGYSRDGALYVPSKKELFREFFSRLNVFRDRRNWLALWSWVSTLVHIVPFVLFLTVFFTWKLFLVAFVYSMVILGTHGTIWYHRYSTHRAYTFANRFWRFITRNLVVKMVPEELYVVSHHVHHWISEMPGDPYNVNGGFWYCFLADAIHQPINLNLTREEYARATKLLEHTGMYLNTYEQYKKWGSISHPGRTILHYVLNWAFWYGTFYLVGGHALACTMFAATGFWGVGVRTFNFSGHGSGKDKRRDGIDFNRNDLSINQVWPGLITGEWHNNHHLYPNGARAGFLPYQLDYAWWYIRGLSAIGAVTTYRDYTEDFFAKYYRPYQQRLMPPAGAKQT